MKMIEQLNQLDRIDCLIRRKATGSPNKLANRLCVSRRTVFNLLETLRAFGAEIDYDRHRESYYYTNQIRFRFDAIVEFPKERAITGGAAPIYFEPMQQGTPFLHRRIAN